VKPNRASLVCKCAWHVRARTHTSHVASAGPRFELLYSNVQHTHRIQCRHVLPAAAAISWVEPTKASTAHAAECPEPCPGSGRARGEWGTRREGGRIDGPEADMATFVTGALAAVAVGVRGACHCRSRACVLRAGFKLQLAPSPAVASSNARCLSVAPEILSQKFCL
jgi:hypothetical protein